MIRRVRALMAVPFAAPPQARRLAWRLMPEAAAAAVYAVLALAALVLALRGDAGPLAGAVRWAYLAAALAAVLVPAGTAAAAVSAERDGGTLETLALLPVGRDELVWGRYWHLAVPWLRFFVWVMPVYGLCGAGLCAPVAGLSETSARLAVWAFAPGAVLGGFLALGPAGAAGAVPDGAVYAVALRLATDVLGVGLAVAAGLYASVRVRPSAAALAAGPAAALVLAVGFCGAPTWAALAIDRMTAGGSPGGRLAGLFLVWTALGIWVEVLLIRRLVAAAARGLEAAGDGETERIPEHPGN